MAASKSTTNRRAVLAGATAALVAGPAAAAATVDADPVFAAMKHKTVTAWANLNALYADIERQTEAMRPKPVMPSELLEPLHLPGRPGRGDAPEEGWSAQTLGQIVRNGTYLTGKTTPTASGATMRTEWKPVSAKTRARAAELLKVRKAYDAEREAWLADLKAIEDASSAPLNEAIDLALELMAHPVFTLAEVKDKMAMATEYDLYNLTNEGDGDLQGWFLRDALAVAEKAVAHV